MERESKPKSAERQRSPRPAEDPSSSWSGTEPAGLDAPIDVPYTGQATGASRIRRKPTTAGPPTATTPATRVQRRGDPGLPDDLRSGVEQLSGLDMSGVRVHYNSAKPAALDAHAYAHGSEIFVGPGQEQHLPHEAWHVAQQASGRVKPTLQMHGAPINDDDGLEREADVMGARALALGAAGESMPTVRRTWSPTSFPVQRYLIYRGMRASAANAATPLQGDALKKLGVRAHDVPNNNIVNGKVVHHAGMSVGTSAKGYPPHTISKAYADHGGSDAVEDPNDAAFLFKWSMDTNNLPAALQAYDDTGGRGEHRLVEPAQSATLTLAQFRAAVQGTQALWQRIDPP